MKINKIINLLFFVIINISFMTCVEDSDFTIPESLGIEENEDITEILDSISEGTLQLKTIEQIKKLYIKYEIKFKINNPYLPTTDLEFLRPFSL